MGRILGWPEIDCSVTDESDADQLEAMTLAENLFRGTLSKEMRAKQLIRWHDIRKSDYVGILVTDQQGALVVSSIPQVEYFYGKAPWWQAVVKGGSLRGYVSEIAFDPGFGTHVVVVAAPILDDTKGTVIGTVTILLRRDTIFHAIAEVTIGATGHAMLFSSDGVLVICPVLAPEEHMVKPDLISAIGGLKAGWTVAADDSHGGVLVDRSSFGTAGETLAA